MDEDLPVVISEHLEQVIRSGERVIFHVTLNDGHHARAFEMRAVDGRFRVRSFVDTEVGAFPTITQAYWSGTYSRIAIIEAMSA